MKTIVLLSAAVVFSMVACKKDAPPDPVPIAPPVAVAPVAPTASVIAVPVASAIPSADPVASAVPVPADYEKEAKKTVTSDSLTSQLDKLEKTIANAPSK